MACHPVLSLASSGHWLPWWMAAVQVRHPFSKPSRAVLQAVLHGPAREGGFGLLSLIQHTFACHAKWFCRTLHALVSMLHTEASHNPAAIPSPDDLDLSDGVQSLRYPDWLSLAFRALKLCVPMHVLQACMSSCFSDLHDLASGWLTDGQSQEILLPAGFLRLTARAGTALGPPCCQLPPDVKHSRLLHIACTPSGIAL
jgi:hypothetical protein